MCTPVSPSAELEERGGHGEELQDKINSLEKELKFMEVKKNEAINKLAQVRPHPPDIPVLWFTLYFVHNVTFIVLFN